MCFINFKSLLLDHKLFNVDQYEFSYSLLLISTFISCSPLGGRQRPALPFSDCTYSIDLEVAHYCVKG